MAAGDLVDRDYHLELRELLHGPGTRFHWDGPWTGFGHTMKTSDVDLEQSDGSYSGRDLLASRVLTFPVGWGGHGPEDVMLDYSELLEAWNRSKDEDLELWMMLPGWGRFFVVGRPRGLVEDLTMLKSGEARALLTFQANDPTIYFPDGSGS